MPSLSFPESKKNPSTSTADSPKILYRNFSSSEFVGGKLLGRVGKLTKTLQGMRACMDARSPTRNLEGFIAARATSGSADIAAVVGKTLHAQWWVSLLLSLPRQRK